MKIRVMEGIAPARSSATTAENLFLTCMCVHMSRTCMNITICRARDTNQLCTIAPAHIPCVEETSQVPLTLRIIRIYAFLVQRVMTQLKHMRHTQIFCAASSIPYKEQAFTATPFFKEEAFACVCRSGFVPRSRRYGPGILRNK